MKPNPECNKTHNFHYERAPNHHQQTTTPHHHTGNCTINSMSFILEHLQYLLLLYPILYFSKYRHNYLHTYCLLTPTAHLLLQNNRILSCTNRLNNKPRQDTIYSWSETLNCGKCNVIGRCSSIGIIIDLLSRFWVWELLCNQQHLVINLNAISFSKNLFCLKTSC